MIAHKWSGWPGAYCTVCFAFDPVEECMAVHDKLDYECINCGEKWPQGMCPATQEAHVVEEISCPDHQRAECPG
jgi:hypothetical protein